MICESLARYENIEKDVLMIFLSRKLMSLLVNNCSQVILLEEPRKSREKRGIFTQLSVICEATVRGAICNIATTRRQGLVEIVHIEISLVNLVSLVKILRNNSLGFIEKRRGRIQAYHCRSGSLTYRRLPFSVRIRRLAQSAVDKNKKTENRK